LSAVESKVQEESAAIQSKIDNIQFTEIDTTSLAKQATLIKESETIQNAIRSIKFPEIDTTELAQQGSDPEATNTAIFNAVNTFLSRSVKYDKTTGNLTIENVELIIE
jgi:hypothetical protein